MKYFITLLFLSLITTNIEALEIKDTRGRIDIPMSNGWSYEKDILGLPHVLITSDKPERSSLSITLTGQNEVKLPTKDLEKNQKQYREGRKIWAQKHEANIIKFHPYEHSSGQEGQILHSIGFEYELNKIKYLEMSFYLECSQNFVHLKYLGPQNSSRSKEASHMVNSIKCLK